MRNADQLRHSAAIQEATASRARSLLEHPELVAAFERVEDDYFARWQNAQTTEQREEIFFRLQGLKAVQADLAAVVSGGQVAAYNTRHLLK